MVKNLPANSGDAGDVGLIPRLGRSPEVGNGNPLQYSCLEKCHEQRSLVGCSLCKESDTTEQLSVHNDCLKQHYPQEPKSRNNISPSIVKQLNKMCYIHPINYYSAIETNETLIHGAIWM